MVSGHWIIAVCGVLPKKLHVIFVCKSPAVATVKLSSFDEDTCGNSVPRLSTDQPGYFFLLNKEPSKASHEIHGNAFVKIALGGNRMVPACCYVDVVSYGCRRG